MSQYLSGLPAWLVQRLSAIYLALYTVAASFMLAQACPCDYPAWRALIQQPLVSSATALFFLALGLHAWVGVRDVILDYCGHRAGLRLGLLALLGVSLLFMGVWMLQILIEVWS